eukprot:TRINITY_DN27064_c0_g1_i1.p1 TRINITY_DN27064_c0_g1~~TRINITY_DN27064_c0_g1_i1.p1  ORF type:complete len:122 (-),score=1.34 TRINITY_DN27064_c0_g1_i1:330-695(-)
MPLGIYDLGAGLVPTERQCWALKQNKERCTISCVRNGNLCWIHMAQSRETPEKFRFVPEFYEKLEETKWIEQKVLSKWENSRISAPQACGWKTSKEEKEYLCKEIQRLESLFKNLGTSTCR